MEQKSLVDERFPRWSCERHSTVATICSVLKRSLGQLRVSGTQAALITWVLAGLAGWPSPLSLCVQGHTGRRCIQASRGESLSQPIRAIECSPLPLTLFQPLHLPGILPCAARRIRRPLPFVFSVFSVLLRAPSGRPGRENDRHSLPYVINTIPSGQYKNSDRQPRLDKSIRNFSRVPRQLLLSPRCIPRVPSSSCLVRSAHYSSFHHPPQPTGRAPRTRVAKVKTKH